MKLLNTILLSLLFCGMAFSQGIPVPLNYSVVDSVSGDLDKDGIKELVQNGPPGKDPGRLCMGAATGE